MVNVDLQHTPGRRRSREEVEADVRAALLHLLAEGKPFKDLTVDELARAAGLSRTAFYFYFPGKSQVLMAVLRRGRRGDVRRGRPDGGTARAHRSSSCGWR